ncbi:unnamed protein product [Dicrocoelium dendriticum]|nr:unnamed protein product [Dicrocoelium dendriticum]
MCGNIIMLYLRATLAVFMMANLMHCESEQHADRNVGLTCSEFLNGKKEGTIHNPKYPKNDYGSKFCNYQISVPSNHQVALTFSELESLFNNLVIFVFDGPDCMSRWIGFLRYLENKVLISSGNSITALLTFEHEVELWRFKGNYSTDYSLYLNVREALKSNAVKSMDLL